MRTANENFKDGNPSASTATSTDTWQKNADQRRKNAILGNVSNATKKSI